MHTARLKPNRAEEQYITPVRFDRKTWDTAAGVAIRWQAVACTSHPVGERSGNSRLGHWIPSGLGKEATTQTIRH